MASRSSEAPSRSSPPGTIPRSTLVRFLTSLLAISPLLVLLLWPQHLLATFFRPVVVFTVDAAGNSLGHDDDDDDARRACGHIAPLPRVVAMAMSADDLTARFLSCRHMAPFLQDFRLRRKLLRNPCLKALVLLLGPPIAAALLEQ